MYNLTSVPEYTGASVLPAGEYVASILDAEVTKSKAGSPMIKVTFDVDGTKVYEYLTLDKQNQQGYNISMSKAKSILLATKCTNFNFRTDLDMADAMVGEVSLTVEVKSEEYQGTMKEKNIIKKFSPTSAPTRRSPRASTQDHDSIPF